MKKALLIIVLLSGLIVPGHLRAQLGESTGEVEFNAILQGAFNLIIQDGDVQTATFASAADYNLGVSETQGTPGIDPGHTTIAMEATGDWYLKIRAADFAPTGTATGSIPINNVGVWCEATGNHQFGVEVSCLYTSADAALGLTNTDQNLIELLTENSGDQIDNQFVLNWLMGTMQGSMNNATMFSQLAGGLFSQGTFTTTIILTMTEIP